MGFLDRSEDERLVWRSDPVTQDYLASLKAKMEAGAQAILSALLDGEEKTAFTKAGYCSALAWAADVLERS